MSRPPTPAPAVLTELVAADADAWDREAHIPREALHRLSAGGLLCPQVPQRFGGLGLGSEQAGELTAHAATLCGSTRSIMTSQGMAAHAIARWGTTTQQATYLPRLVGGAVAGVAFSEPGAGSDLAAMETRIERDGDTLRVAGHKTWVTGAAYADWLVVFGRHGSGGAAVLVPTEAAGVEVEPVPAPLGCRAAGHADVTLDVQLPATQLLPGSGQPLMLLVTLALTFGRLSVAWGCVGILRACLAAAAAHASSRRQFGKRLAEHQLVARHLGELLAAEQAATRVCEHASRCWDDGSPDLVPAAVVAKHVAASGAARGAAAAVQVLASAGARDHHVVARAYRDAKLMEIIEGSSEICQLLLAEHALAAVS